jgi:cyclopropane-fatty-acyl-phospholipid synthase
MGLIEFTASAFERADVPDSIARMGVAYLVGRTARSLAHADPETTRAFAEAMTGFPIAMNTDEANAQHYEVPADFFEIVLGPQRKYSCCIYPFPTTTLMEAEELALAETASHADLADGQDVLELGCGWGSLSLWMARRYPSSRILSVSNSRSQRDFIERRADEEGLNNIQVVTADMNAFATGRTFDRVVSVEMFEHMSNWRPLLARVRDWLKPEGRLFIHIFTHRTAPYRFDPADKTDWIAQHFFTGGIMPSHGLIRSFDDLFAVENEWQWEGGHYARTARDWLSNFDASRETIERVLTPVYGSQTQIWMRRWRLFFLATEGLFGHADGREWGVSHYRLTPVRR